MNLDQSSAGMDVYLTDLLSAPVEEREEGDLRVEGSEVSDHSHVLAPVQKTSRCEQSRRKSERN